MNIGKPPVKHWCQYKQRPCEYANSWGKCLMTACVRHGDERLIYTTTCNQTCNQTCNKKQVTSKLEPAEFATSEGEESTIGQPKSKLDCISRQQAIEAIECVDWYHVNSKGELVHGSTSDEESWYKAEDIYEAIESLPPVTPTEHKTTETMIVDGEPTEIDPLSYEVGYTHGQFSERPEGEWKDRIFDGCLERECDQCGEMIDAYIFRQNRYNYCPNCGADMKGDKK